MSKSVWIIVIMGGLCAFVLVLAMSLGLAAFSQTPAMSRTRLALAIQQEFTLEAVGTEIREEGMKTVLFVTFETRSDSKFNAAFQNQEIQRVGEYALLKVEGKAKEKIDEARLTRAEIKGSGCFLRRYTSFGTVENPYKKTDKTDPFQWPERKQER